MLLAAPTVVIHRTGTVRSTSVPSEHMYDDVSPETEPIMVPSAYLTNPPPIPERAHHQTAGAPTGDNNRQDVPEPVNRADSIHERMQHQTVPEPVNHEDSVPERAHHALKEQSRLSAREQVNSDAPVLNRVDSSTSDVSNDEQKIATTNFKVIVDYENHKVSEGYEMPVRHDMAMNEEESGPASPKCPPVRGDDCDNTGIK